MKHVKTLTLAFALMFVLATVAFAGETSSPPAQSSCAPGETHSPPCPAHPVNEYPVVLGETPTPPALHVVDVTDIAETLMWSLLLF